MKKFLQAPPALTNSDFAAPSVWVPMPEAENKGERVSLATQKRRYELLTPLIGGREAGEVDEDFPVNEKSVRGALRFWWRTLRGGNYGGDLGAMHAAQTRLWGGTDEQTPDTGAPSLVQVRVNVTKKGRRVGSDVFKPIQYFAFPLVDKKGVALADVEFEVEISFPDDATTRLEVEAALWGWETFDGIGARTNRCFGAIRLAHIAQTEQQPADLADFRNGIIQKLDGIVASGPWPDGVPFLCRDTFDNDFKCTAFFERKNTHNLEQLATGLTRKAKQPYHTSSDRATQRLCDLLKGFRQARSGAFGRSKWPEPDAIRRMTGQHLSVADILGSTPTTLSQSNYEEATRNRWKGGDSKNHSPVHPVRAVPPDGQEPFPRAAFGLPIKFHFKDNNRKGTNSDRRLDPVEADLQLQNSDRCASTLLMRPVQVRNNHDIGSIGIVLRLHYSTTHAPQPLLVCGRRSYSVRGITHAEAKQIEPLKKFATGTGDFDVLDAFLRTIN